MDYEKTRVKLVIARNKEITDEILDELHEKSECS